MVFKHWRFSTRIYSYIWPIRLILIYGNEKQVNWDDRIISFWDIEMLESWNMCASLASKTALLGRITITYGVASRVSHGYRKCLRIRHSTAGSAWEGHQVTLHTKLTHQAVTALEETTSVGPMRGAWSATILWGNIPTRFCWKKRFCAEPPKIRRRTMVLRGDPSQSSWPVQKKVQLACRNPKHQFRSLVTVRRSTPGLWFWQSHRLLVISCNQAFINLELISCKILCPS